MATDAAVVAESCREGRAGGGGGGRGQRQWAASPGESSVTGVTDGEDGGGCVAARFCSPWTSPCGARGEGDGSGAIQIGRAHV